MPVLFYEGKSLNKLLSAARQLALHSRLRMSLPKDPLDSTFAPGCGLILIHGELERIMPFMQELEGVRSDVSLALSPTGEDAIYAVRVLPTNLYGNPEQLEAHLVKEQALVDQLIAEKLGGTRPAERPAPPSTPLAEPERLTRHLPPPSYQRFPFAQRLRRRLAREASGQTRAAAQNDE